MSRTIVLIFLAACVLAPYSASAITIPTVPVRDLGNPHDLTAVDGPFGAVAYSYRMGTTEVTVGQYTAFLNAVATTDTYALYNTLMTTNLTSGGISRSGSAGSYSYSVIGSANHPVTFVSWGDAVRFTNWLHNGQPSGAQGPGTTETGAYTLNGATDIGGLKTVTRNSGAVWFLPTQDEWYKAAYYQPAAQGGDVDGYWKYAMRTNSVPYSDQPPGATPNNTRVGNYFNDDGLANGYNDGYAVTGSPSVDFSQNYLTDVGAYTSSPSFYGTYDQSGNVWEWNETLFSSALRVIRGGSFDDSESGLSIRVVTDPTQERVHYGFRVAMVPEPSSIALAVIALVGSVLFRPKLG